MEHLKGKILLYLFVIGVIRECDSFPDNVGAENNDVTIAPHIGPMMNLLLQFLPPELHNNAAIISANAVNSRLSPSSGMQMTTREAGESSKAEGVKRRSNLFSNKLSQYCGECDLPFESMRNYKQHVRVKHTGKKMFDCTVPGCYKSFKALSTLYSHRKNIHQIGMTKRDPNCHLCEAEFRNTRQLNRHFKTMHQGELKFQCKYCKEMFEKEYRKTAHESEVHEHKCFECDVCQRTFATRWYLNIHEQKCRDRQSKEMAEHERMRECHLCHKKFVFPREKERYASHMLRYKKNPHCPVCGIILGERKRDGSNTRDLVEHIRRRHPDKFPKIDIKAVIENKEAASVWKNGDSSSTE